MGFVLSSEPIKTNNKAIKPVVKYNKTVFNNGLRYSFGTKDTLAAPNAYNIELIIKGLLLASEISLTNIIMRIMRIKI